MGRATKRTQITTPEKTAKINPNNMALKDEFLLYMKSLNRSPGTISGYDSDLTIVFTYMLDNLNNKDFCKLSKRDIINIQNWMISIGNSSARIRRVKAAISSLSNYIENIVADDDPELEGYRSIVRKIDNPPLVPVREKTVWEDEELEKLLERLTEFKEYEKACFVALAMYGGRRKAELCRFRVSDFAEDKITCNGALYRSDLILTKGNKYLACYTLKKKFDPYLKNWMDYRAKYGIESEWLFPSHSDSSKTLEISTVDSWAKTFSNMTGQAFYFHSLRHFFVSAMSRAGLPDNIVVLIMGWKSADMFNIYNDNSKDDQISMYFKDGDIDTSAKKGIDEL